MEQACGLPRVGLGVGLGARLKVKVRARAKVRPRVRSKVKASTTYANLILLAIKFFKKFSYSQ